MDIGTCLLMLALAYGLGVLWYDLLPARLPARVWRVAAAAKRQIIELLVARIRVDTIETNGRKEARLTISYTFAPEGQTLDGFSIGTPTTEPYSVQEPS
jgi:hypothetical protein